MHSGIVVAIWMALLAIAASSFAGCGRVMAEGEVNVVMIGYVPSRSHDISRRERTAIELAFSEANKRRALRSKRIVLEDGVSERDVAVIAARNSIEEAQMGYQLVFVGLSHEKRGLALQPMRSLDCLTGVSTCGAALAQRKGSFATLFRACVNEPPPQEAYIAYAEAESVILASQRLLAEGQLSYATLRRALLFGEFSTVIGTVRYAIPPEMIDETMRQNALALNQDSTTF